MVKSKSPSRKQYGFSHDSNEKLFDEINDLGYVNSFHLLITELLMQIITFEKIVDFCHLSKRSEEVF